MKTIDPNERTSEVLPAGSELTVSVAGGSASVVRSFGASVVEGETISETKTYGPYAQDMAFAIACFSGVVSVALSFAVGPLSALTPAQVAAVASSAIFNDYGLSYAPTRDTALAYGIQFRGTADSASSLGQLGLVVNEATNASASTRLSLSDADWSSPINGATSSGTVSVLGPFGAPVLRIHLAQLGLADPYTVDDSGEVLAATPGMARLTWDAALNVRALLVIEGPPTDFAGASGTGSARTVSVVGLATT